MDRKPCGLFSSLSSFGQNDEMMRHRSCWFLKLHTHTHTHVYMYVYTYACIYTCVYDDSRPFRHMDSPVAWHDRFQAFCGQADLQEPLALNGGKPTLEGNDRETSVRRRRGKETQVQKNARNTWLLCEDSSQLLTDETRKHILVILWQPSHCVVPQITLQERRALQMRPFYYKLPAGYIFSEASWFSAKSP